MKTYYYYCEYPREGLKPDAEEIAYSWTHDDIRAVNGGFDDFECRWMVEELAKHYYNYCDGWDNREWASGREPMVFFIFDEDKNFLFSTTVDIEMQPEFSAGIIDGDVV